METSSSRRYSPIVDESFSKDTHLKGIDTSKERKSVTEIKKNSHILYAIASAVTFVVGVILIALSLTHFFGPVGTIGFMGALTAGAVVDAAVLTTMLVYFLRQRAHRLKENSNNDSTTAFKKEETNPIKNVSHSPHNSKGDSPIKPELETTRKFNLEKKPGQLSLARRVENAIDVIKQASLKLTPEIKDPSQRESIEKEIAEARKALEQNISEEGLTLLHEAAFEGRLDLVTSILNHGVNPLFADKNGQTPLDYAILGEKMICVRLLFPYSISFINPEHGTFINTVYPKYFALQTEIQEALNSTDGSQQQRLEKTFFEAAKYGFCNLLRILMDHGVSEEITDAEGNIPINYAIANFQVDAVKLLYSKNKISFEDNLGRKSIDFALLSKNAEIIEIIDKGYKAFKEKVEQAIQEYSTKITPTDPVDVTTEIKTLQNLFLEAASNGYWNLIKSILELKAIDINATNTEDFTALHLAAQKGHAITIDLLIRHAAQDLSVTSTGETALHFAVQSGSFACVNRLLEHVTSISKNKSHQTPLDVAFDHLDWNTTPYFRIIQALLKSPILPEEATNYLLEAAKHCPVSVVERLVQKDADINTLSGGKTALHNAVQRGNVEVVQFLSSRLEKLPVDDQGKTPVHYLAGFSNKKIASEMLTALSKVKGFDIAAKDGSGQTALHCAVESKNMDIALLLLDHQHPVDVKDGSGRAPLLLHIAAQLGREDLIDQFLALRVDPKALDNNDRTPAALSLIYKNDAFTKKLINLKNCHFGKDVNGQTAIHYAAKHEFIEKDLLKVILNNSDLNEKDSKGMTALHLAIQCYNYRMVKELSSYAETATLENSAGQHPLHLLATLKLNSKDAKKYLKRLKQVEGFNIDAQDSKSKRALQLALEGKNLEVARALIEANAAISEKEAIDFQLLAAEMGSVEDVKFSLSITKNINAQNNDGMTALHVAAHLARAEIVELLLDSGADTNCVNKKGQTALHLASIKSNERILTRLISPDIIDLVDHDNKMTALHYAAQHHNLKALEFLTAHGAKFVPTAKDQTCLHLAAPKGSKEVVTFLLKQDNIDINAQDSSGMTAFTLMIRDGKPEDNLAKAQLFFQHKTPPIFNVDSNQKSILHYLCVNGSKELLDLIFPHAKIFINAKDHLGKTPFYMACESGNGGTVMYLLQNGADKEINDNNNKSPLEAVQAALIEAKSKLTEAQEIKDKATKEEHYKSSDEKVKKNYTDVILKNVDQWESKVTRYNKIITLLS